MTNRKEDGSSSSSFLMSFYLKYSELNGSIGLRRKGG
jgi:hypothetical protein